MSESKQAIVMPTKNRLDLLRRAVDSVLSQKYKNWRLVIVNDGSNDGTKEYLTQISAQDSRIETIHFEISKGVNAARNAGFDRLDGDEYVSCLDDDDYFSTDALSVMNTIFQSCPAKTSGFFFNTYNVTNNGIRLQGFRFGATEKVGRLTYLEVMTKSRFSGDCHPVFKASLFGRDSRYRYYEDINGFETEILMLMIRDGVDIFFFPEAVVFKDHSHDSPHLSDYAARTNPESFMKAHVRILQAHKSFFASHPCLAAQRAIASLKISIRAMNVGYAIYFMTHMLYQVIKCWLRMIFLRIKIRS